MRPRRFHAANAVFRLPGGNEDNDLWVERGEVDDEVLGRYPSIRSVYELTAEEREQVAAGASVSLVILGTEQPPVMLYVTDEPLGKAPTL